MQNVFKIGERGRFSARLSQSFLQVLFGFFLCGFLVLGFDVRYRDFDLSESEIEGIVGLPSLTFVVSFCYHNITEFSDWKKGKASPLPSLVLCEQFGNKIVNVRQDGQRVIIHRFPHGIGLVGVGSENSLVNLVNDLFHKATFKGLEKDGRPLPRPSFSILPQ